MASGDHRPRRIKATAIWWLVLIMLFMSGAVLAARESAALVHGLQTEILVAVEDVQIAFAGGDMALAEHAAMRLWRLAELEANTFLASGVGRELSRLAVALTDAASGWKVSPPLAAEQRQVKSQLVSLRQMILTGDYSQAETVLVWLGRR